MGTQFAVIKVDKVKSLAGLNGRSNHNLRESKTPEHADPSKKNIFLAGQKTNAGVVAEWKKITAGMTVRKNAVYALEYMMTASPEFFQTATPAQKKGWVKESLAFIEKKHGAENILQAVVHLDEVTPHIHILVVPVDPKKTLNASYFVDGKKLLKALQTAYAATVAKFGLRRGLENSEAKSMRPREYRKALALSQKPLPELSMADHAAAAIGHKTKAMKAYEAIIQAQQIVMASKTREKELAKAAAEAEDEARRSKARLERIEGDLETEKALHSKARQELGYTKEDLSAAQKHALELAEEVKRLKPKKTGEKVIPLFRD